MEEFGKRQPSNIPLLGRFRSTPLRYHSALLAYALVGSSRHLAVGPVAIVSLLVHVACSKVGRARHLRISGRRVTKMIVR